MSSRMATWWRWIWRGFLWLLGLVLIVVCIAGIYFSTHAGLKSILSIANNVLPGTLTYQRVQGTITSPIVLTDLHYQDGEQSISIAHLDFSWRLGKLLVGKLDFKSLMANHITIINPPTPTPSHHEDSDSSAFQLPVKLSIKKGELADIRYGTSAKALHTQIHSIALQGHFSNDNLNGNINILASKPYAVQTNVTLTGKLAHFSYDANAKNPDFNLHLDGQGSPHAATVNIKESDLFGGRLKGHVKADWKNELTWQADLHGKQLRLKRLYHKLPRLLDIDLKTQGKKQPHWIFTFNTLIKAPNTFVHINASHDQQWHAKWDIASSNLGLLYSDLQGKIKTQGQLEGRWPNLQTTGTLLAQQLQVADKAVRYASGDWKISLNPTLPAHIQLAFTDIAAFGQTINHIKLNANGTLANHQLSAQLINAYGKLTLAANGHWNEPQWQGQLTQLRIQSDKINNWNLVRSTAVTVSPTAANINPLCVNSSAHGQVCLQGNWSDSAAWKMKLHASKIDLGKIISVRIPTTTVKSTTSLNATIQGNGNTLQPSQATLSFSPGRMSYYYAGIKRTQTFQGGDWKWQYTPKTGLTSHLQLSVDNRDRLAAKLDIPGLFKNNQPISEQPITGSVTSHLSNLKWIAGYIPNVEPKGTLSVHMKIAGTVGEPQITGNTTLNGQVELTLLGIRLTQFTSKLTVANKKLDFHISALSKGKPITMTGFTDLNAKTFLAEFNIKGQDILIINNSEYRITMSPDIHIHFKKKHIKITGEVGIPKAYLAPQDLTVVTTLPDNHVVFIGIPDTTQPESIWKMSAALKINLGDNVEVDAKGLTALLTGSFEVTKTPKTDWLGDGTIVVNNGLFQAYGKSLTIGDGSSVSFARSPLSNPHLNITAIKTFNLANQPDIPVVSGKLIAGIHIQGTADEPKISLFSRPATLSQADILSMLILGHTAGSNSPGNVSMLLSAMDALNLGSTGIGGLASEIKQGLGLTEFGVQSETAVDAAGNPINQQTNFVIGRHLTPRIYVRFSKGIDADAQDEFQIRYLLGKNWYIQTATGGVNDDTGADIVYTFQTG